MTRLTSAELEELKRAEFVEACSDDGFGPRLRELRERLRRHYASVEKEGTRD